MKRHWHYTKGTTLLHIIADQQIRRATAGVLGRERRAVWFTNRDTWEPTATSGIHGPTGFRRHATMAEMVEHGGALVRLEVPTTVARHSWATHRQIGQIDPRMADGLENAARARGSDPSDWWISYRDVPWLSVLTVEGSDDGLTWANVGYGTPLDSLDADFVEKIQGALARSPFSTISPSR